MISLRKTNLRVKHFKMKKLIVIIHPNLEKSIINKRWEEELNKYPNQFDIHDLYKIYPDEKIDVLAEQKLLESYDTVVFQFPFYWFNCPPLLKKWLDEVLTYGWAYGSKSGYKLKDKKIALAITAGIDEDEYNEFGKYKYTLEELTAPFELTFKYIKANYKNFYAFYGIEKNSSSGWVEKSVPGYISFIETL